MLTFHGGLAESNMNVKSWLGAGFIAGAFCALAWLERRRPLRRRMAESKFRREVRNLSVAAVGAGALLLMARPAILPLAQFVEVHNWGLLKQLRLPRWLEIALAVILLDYTLYIWHYLTHRVPLLWRFHEAHHVDLDLDASTALRFHFGELALSIPWRASQIAAIGVTPLALRLWQNALLVSILFHHSNVQLPIALERPLGRVFVTPRMHGIHHSIVPEETNANWSSGLTIWDWLHGTLRLNVPQREITIGVPAYREPRELTLGRSLEMPFRQQRPWQLLPGNGEPSPHGAVAPPDRLLS